MRNFQLIQCLIGTSLSGTLELTHISNDNQDRKLSMIDPLPQQRSTPVKSFLNLIIAFVILVSVSGEEFGKYGMDLTSFNL